MKFEMTEEETKQIVETVAKVVIANTRQHVPSVALSEPIRRPTISEEVEKLLNVLKNKVTKEAREQIILHFVQNRR